MCHYWAVGLVGALLTACCTAYKEEGFSGGYSKSGTARASRRPLPKSTCAIPVTPATAGQNGNPVRCLVDNEFHLYLGVVRKQLAEGRPLLIATRVVLPRQGRSSGDCR
jgi:hypothetical protein